jgi:hypothetical protein
VYAVLDRPNGANFEPCFELPIYQVPFRQTANGPSKYRVEYITTGGGWSLRGRVPVDNLRFEHHERVSYVTRGSLERSLSVAGV